MDLYNEVSKLIHLRQEGNYWDFKKEWYGDNGELLKDIICMANNQVGKDAFLIIGVDEEENYSVRDISKDINRKSTQNITDFLRSVKFAGEYRPIVSVEPLHIENKEIDVIVIYNSLYTPFYLKERFRKVNPGNIYVRLQDTSTPIDGTADFCNTEYLWKKRFGLLESPLERFGKFITDKRGWADIPSLGGFGRYYNLFPEFTIVRETDDSRTGKEYYTYSQIDNIPHWGTISLRYYQTTLLEFDAVYLDGFRYFTSTPRRQYVELSGVESKFYWYFTKESYEYLLHEFFIDAEEDREAQWSRNQFENEILIFRTELEKEAFDRYLETSWCNVNPFDEQYVKKLPNALKDQCKNETHREQYLIMLALQDILQEYRSLCES